MINKSKIALKFSKYGKYAPIIWKNRLNKVLHRKKEHKFLFILSPPFCGSTLLNELIATSNSVSVNNSYGTREGQKLPTTREIMFNHARRWDPTFDFDWSYIKKEWMKYWNLNYPILLEKSPPSIVRAKSIEKTFKPSFFLIFYRNPYAHCESIMRRNNTTPADAAKFAIKCLNFQKQNLFELGNKVQLSYEILTEETTSAINLMTKMLPELNDINANKEFSAHSYLMKKMKIENLNNDKISKLSGDHLNEINAVFKNNKSTLDFFNYELVEKNAGNKIYKKQTEH